MEGLPDGAVLRNLPTMQEPLVQSLGQEDPLEKEMEIYFSSLAWKIPWTQRSLEAYSSWGCKRVRHNLETKTTHRHR